MREFGIGTDSGLALTANRENGCSKANGQNSPVLRSSVVTTLPWGNGAAVIVGCWPFRVDEASLTAIKPAIANAGIGTACVFTWPRVTRLAGWV